MRNVGFHVRRVLRPVEHIVRAYVSEREVKVVGKDSQIPCAYRVDRERLEWVFLTTIDLVHCRSIDDQMRCFPRKMVAATRQVPDLEPIVRQRLDFMPPLAKNGNNVR